ncbi:MAG: adenylate/guanylate cyclase domain-containing protein [Rhodothermaceae bacterium]|nr:adenylate/guanylate cyclase domain-containing protein [Rhodothermaceae bacterium]
MSYEKTKLAIVFADISKSTQLFEAYGNLRARNIVSHTLNLLSEVTKKYEGTVIKEIGDEVMCTFEDLEKAVEAVIRMPQALLEDPLLIEVGIVIKVGLHYGDVLKEENDVYGDAVNVAARMVQLARPEQIITSRDTVDLLPRYQMASMRSLGSVQVRGKQDDIEIYELLWQSDATDLTIMHGQSSLVRRGPKSQLTLRYSGQDISVAKEKVPFMIGRGDKNDLVVQDQSVSRTHATIEYRRGKYVLIDRSTNGTFLQIQDEETVFLHRDQMHLRREGVILLGQDGSESCDHAIHFQCAYQSDDEVINA